MIRLYVVEWFLHHPAPRPAGCSSYDRGRKAHLALPDAVAHYQALVAAGVAAAAAVDPADDDKHGASLQSVELRAVTTADLTTDLVVALIDDLWATPHLRPPKGGQALPWRADEARQPWVASQRVLQHWAPTLSEE